MLRQLPVKKFKRKKSICPFFYHSVFIEKNFFSNVMRQLLNDKHQNAPPPWTFYQNKGRGGDF